MKFNTIDVTMHGGSENFTVVVEFCPNWLARLFGAGKTTGKFYSNIGLTWVDLATHKPVERGKYSSFNWRLVDYLQLAASNIKEMTLMLEQDISQPEIEEELIH